MNILTLQVPYKSTLNTNLGSPTREKQTVGSKKPFSRPFNKSRIENSTSTPRMSSPTSAETSTLLRQNQELRQRLQDEAGSYRRRIDAYKQAQQNQAALVSRLQAKVLQYKQRCNDLEGKIHDIKPISTCSPKKSSMGPVMAAETIKKFHSTLEYFQCPSSGMPLPPPPAHHTHQPTSLPCSSPPLDTPPPCRDYVHHDHDDICRNLDEEKHR